MIIVYFSQCNNASYVFALRYCAQIFGEHGGNLNIPFLFQTLVCRDKKSLIKSNSNHTKRTVQLHMFLSFFFIEKLNHPLSFTRSFVWIKSVSFSCLNLLSLNRNSVEFGNLGITPNYGLGDKSAQLASRSKENQVQLQS